MPDTAPAPLLLSPPLPREGGALICLNMIVRNESRIILRCLRAVADHIACWVIGDTGSTDGTQEIIRRFFAERSIPGELHEFPFIDFSQARNEALDRARASPLDFDYLMFVDADMEFVTRDLQFRRGLTHTCYNMLQNSGISYYNNRLLRRDAPGRYVGATHEYLKVPNRTERLSSAWFIDHANGSNRREKIERDLRLLRQSLETDPENHRSWFYLAQTYRDGHMLPEAIDAFRKRAELGGWEEEAFQARWQLARCLLKSGEENEFLRAAMEAYNFRPQRAEPLYDLAKFWRERKCYDMACTFAEMGLATPWPDRDVLFVEDHIYSVGFAHEYSICGYYSHQPRHRERGEELCDWLSMRRDVPRDTRDLARHNAGYYARPLATIAKSVSWQTFAVPGWGGFKLTAPSLAMRRGELGLLVRATPRAQTEGDARFVVFLLDGDLRVHGHQVLAAPPDATAGRAELLVRDNAFWCLLGGTPAAPTAFVLAPLELQANGAPMAEPLPLKLPRASVVMDCGGKARFITSYGPMRIADETGKLLFDRLAPMASDNFGRASSAVPFDGGWLAVVQERRVYNGVPRVLHRFVWLDPDGLPAQTSFRFDLREAGTETVTGLSWHPDRKRLLLAAVAADGAPLVARMDAADARALLRPYMGEFRHGRHTLGASAEKPRASSDGRLHGSVRRDLVLFRAHEWNDQIRQSYRRLVREASHADVHALGYVGPKKRVPDPGQDLAFFVGAPDMLALPYPGKVREFSPNRTTGANDLPVMWFYRNFPGYDRYWVVEYDVYYTGRWGELFDDLNQSDADLLAVAIQDQQDNPRWGWWRSLRPGNLEVPPHKITKSFLPFCRLSRRALAAIDAAYEAGLCGHYEVTWATICRLAGLVIEEIGSDGPYTPRHRRGRYYTTNHRHWTLFPGTFVYRPGFRPEDVKRLGSSYDGSDLLWHPVKP